ncbi:MAG TPA: hypothetical protein VGT60_10525 [Candidatus Limnocylindria bacterium]|nr:hypothetical protein [Candidatus Limnocylindria bacterium]
MSWRPRAACVDPGDTLVDAAAGTDRRRAVVMAPIAWDLGPQRGRSLAGIRARDAYPVGGDRVADVVGAKRAGARRR